MCVHGVHGTRRITLAWTFHQRGVAGWFLRLLLQLPLAVLRRTASLETFGRLGLSGDVWRGKTCGGPGGHVGVVRHGGLAGAGRGHLACGGGDELLVGELVRFERTRGEFTTFSRCQPLLPPGETTSSVSAVRSLAVHHGVSGRLHLTHGIWGQTGISHVW